ncbi:MAG: alpha/beta hydrolase [Acidimicrobiales bacterium]
MPSAEEIQQDRRLDPRVKRMLKALPATPLRDAAGRDELVAAANSPRGLAIRAAVTASMEKNDVEALAPSVGLRWETLEFTSTPDGNRVRFNWIRPRGDDVVPAVVYLHGGGMMTGSAFDGNYRAFGKLVAAHGVGVAMIEFRNCLVPSSSGEEIAPYPGGLNDCVSAVRWVAGHADELGIDASRVVVAGESGGGNLTLATGMRLLREGDVELVSGLYALCPYIAGRWPQARLPSTIENNGIFVTLGSNRERLAYGIEAFEARDPLAWPLFATVDDVAGLPPVMISVNEADPLRDEGIEFYRLLLEAGVAARCRQVMGTMHGTELMPMICPDISRDTARDLAGFTIDS